MFVGDVIKEMKATNSIADERLIFLLHNLHNMAQALEIGGEGFDKIYIRICHALQDVIKMCKERGINHRPEIPSCPYCLQPLNRSSVELASRTHTADIVQEMTTTCCNKKITIGFDCKPIVRKVFKRRDDNGTT